MRAYPEPQKEVSFLVGWRHVIAVDPYGPHVLFPVYALEAQGRIERILKPQPEGFASFLLYFRGKPLKILRDTRGDFTTLISG